MNFFQAQEQARKRTRWLILWFAGGVLATVTSLYAVVVAGAEFLKQDRAWQGDWWNQPTALWTAGIGFLVVSLGSVFKLSQLSHGGSVIALDLGARKIDLSSRVASERQLLNVVEEMAIASGIPMPEVWVMDDEHSINAFAAGTEPANAVVGVSFGCLKQLSRDELQGVIAHEFSHILNGDMRLNVRLIGWVFGLLMITIIGRGLMSSTRHIRVSSSRDSKGNLALILALLGVGACLWVIGSLGVLFGRIIQSAVSRQREYLADASAVQFTRNPQGIAGALKKILTGGRCRLNTPAAAEAAHLFFASGVSGFFQQWFATHPPLDERIRAIDRDWSQHTTEERPGTSAPANESSAPTAIAGFSSALNIPQAQQLRRTMSGRGQIEGIDDAKGLIFALVVVADPQHPTHLTQSAEVMRSWNNWSEKVPQMTSAEKIAWMDVAFPWLRDMKPTEYRGFCADLQAVMEMDGKVSLFEWMLFHAIQRHLHGFFEQRKPKPMQWHQLAEVEEPLAALIACVGSLSANHQVGPRVQAEYRQLTQRDLPMAAADFSRMDASLASLDQAAPNVKMQTLSLCRMTIEEDGVVNEEEIQMLRAISDALGLPLIA